MAKKQRSQLMELFLHVAEQLGYSTDRELAGLAEVSTDNVANWRTGAVKEFKSQTLEALKKNLAGRIGVLRERLGWAQRASETGLAALEVEENSGPAALQRQFADRVVYDYLGHRFLYFEPQGALAWENLIRGAGYQQDCWLGGVEEALTAWLDTRKDNTGRCKGAIAAVLGYDRKAPLKGLDVVSLGSGEGEKDAAVLSRLVGMQDGTGKPLSWLMLALVDVSIPLLLTAARASRRVAPAQGVDPSSHHVLPFCADFEEGGLSFIKRLPTGADEVTNGVRLVMLLGNVFGNLRDEEAFMRQRMTKMLRKGDLLWLEVGLRSERIEDEPLFEMTKPDYQDTSAFSSRRLLLEGPFRRWEAAFGRRPSEVSTRVWVREKDDSSRVPGSVNFCHDLQIKDQNRVCTMLYSRRYELEGLTGWLESRDYEVLRVLPVEDTERRQRVVHVLARLR